MNFFQFKREGRERGSRETEEGGVRGQRFNLKKKQRNCQQQLVKMDGFENCLFKHTYTRKGIKIKRRKIGEKGESESESYQPDFHQMKKYGLPIKESRVSSGSWSLEENKLYLRFMLENRTDLETEQNRRRSRVFYRLSKVLKKRTPDQCRSHHQKLQIKYKDQFPRILEAVRQKIAEESQIDLNDDLSGRQSGCVKRTQATWDVNDDEEVTPLALAVDFGDIAFW